jgi:catalase (peroxidase I)
MKILTVVFVVIAFAQQSVGFLNIVNTPFLTSRTSSALCRFAVSTKSTNSELDASNECKTRRSVFESLVVASLSSALVLSPTVAAFATTDSVDYKAVADDISALIAEVPDRGPTLVRLAWHSSGTYDKMLTDGGSSGGTIRFKEELAHGGNAGLATTAVSWMDPIYAKYEKQGLSYADLYTLGGGAYFIALYENLIFRVSHSSTIYFRVSPIGYCSRGY